MDNSVKSVAPVAHSLDDKGSGSIRVQNADELRLAQMGKFDVTKASTFCSSNNVFYLRSNRP